MKAFLTHYSGDWTWVKDFTDDYEIWNRSDEDIPGSIRRENVGDADYDKLTWLVENYNNLPDVFLWTKSNLLDRFITPEEFDMVKNNQDFTPLLTKNHKTYEPVCRYEDTQYGPIYAEINNSWYLAGVPSKYFSDYGDFAKTFRLQNPAYLKFAPGGSYILTRERVHRYARDFYDELRAILPYCQRPGEAHMIERSYFSLWS